MTFNLLQINWDSCQWLDIANIETREWSSSLLYIGKIGNAWQFDFLYCGILLAKLHEYLQSKL